MLNTVFVTLLVYAEVETRIQALRHLLLEKLLQTPSTLHDQKRYIRSLCTVLALWLPYFLLCISFQTFWVFPAMRLLYCLLLSVIFALPPFCFPLGFSFLFFTCVLDLLLLRQTCHDHIDQLLTTWQHLSSCCIRQSSEHPLRSCLLFVVDGGRCVRACMCVSLTSTKTSEW